MKKLLLFAILFVFALYILNSVFACSIAEPSVIINCNNENIPLQQICDENFNDLKPIYDREVQKWKSDNHEYSLIFETYSSARENELIESKNSYGNCHYEDYKRAGDWFIITPKSRDYCYEVGGGGGMCSTTTKSYLKFFAFLLTHPNINTLPYLLGYLVVLGIVIGFIVYLYNRNELKLFFKPNKLNVIFTLVLGTLSLIYLSLYIGIRHNISIIFGYYIVLSLIRYIYMRNKKK